MDELKLNSEEYKKRFLSFCSKELVRDDIAMIIFLAHIDEVDLEDYGNPEADAEEQLSHDY